MERAQPRLQIGLEEKLNEEQISTLMGDLLEYVTENCRDCISDSVADIIPREHPQFRDIENKVFEQIPKRL